MVGFGLIGGKSLVDLQTSSDAAEAKWIYIKSIVSEVCDLISIPAAYSLSQNYPNPFNPVTRISYDLPSRSRVEIKVMDVLGREVATLAKGEQPAGRYTVPLDASRLASGVYFYRLAAEVVSSDGIHPKQNFVDVKKLAVVK